MLWKTFSPLWAFLQLCFLQNFKAMGMFNYEFLVIRDTTFLCSEGQRALNFRKAELTDDDKMALLESKGGHNLVAYMARDQRSAQENFINPLSYHSFEQENVVDGKDNVYAFISPVDKRAFKQKAAVIKYLKELVDNESRKLAEDIEEAYVTQSEKDSDLISSNRRTGHKRGRRKRHLTSKTNPTQMRRHFNSTMYRNVPYVLPEELGIKSPYIKTVSGHTLQRDGQTQIFYPLRVETTIDYCHPRGTATEDGNYLHMCTTCAATTTLPDNYYPRVINEAICTAGDATCFIVDDIPQGECKQRQILMDILMRKEGFCTLALKNGEMVVVDEWELISYAINVGCECTIDKDSIYSAFV